MTLTMPPAPPLNDGSGPSAQELEVGVIGPGFGESIVLHIGCGKWAIIDSCIETGSDEPAPLRYLKAYGVDIENDVEWVIVTHWDDDHVKGVSRVVEKCKAATVAMASIFRSDDFLEFVSLGAAIPLAGKAGRRTSELKKLLDYLFKSGRFKSIVWAGKDRRLAARGEDIEIWSLSPSDVETTKFLAEVGREIKPDNEALRVPRVARRNDISVVIQVLSAFSSIILGGDLEEHGDQYRGWSSVLASSGRPQKKSNVYKVAHHGSKTGHHDGIWTNLLTENPISVIAPWRRGGGHLPTDDDVERVRGLSAETYLTATRVGKKSPKLSRDVEGAMAGIVRKRTAITVRPGAVRLRLDSAPGAEWVTELFAGATST